MIDSQKFKDLLSSLPTAVFVVGFRTGNEIVGCTISSVISLDVEKNQKILFTLGKNSRFGTMINSNHTISVNLLNFDQIPEAIHFSKVRGELVDDKLFKWKTETNLISLEGCETFLNCKLNNKISTESNMILILDVIHIEVAKIKKPLLYMNRKFNPTI